MKRESLSRLACPDCECGFEPQNISWKAGEIESGALACTRCGVRFEIVNFVPRFVAPNNYAENFGFQWNRFRRTQLDSYSGTKVSFERFQNETGWNKDTLRGGHVLDAGCGAGRFAEIALSLGATVYAIDYSRAVDACYANLGAHPNLHVFQADIYHLPFPAEAFDCIYSLGVLQHTPDPLRAIDSLVRHLKPGGSIVVDFYIARWINIFHAKYILRPISTRLSGRALFSVIERAVPYLLPLSDAVASLPWIGAPLSRMVPVANYRGKLPLNHTQLAEWAILDTFDWLSPAYDHPHSAKKLKNCLERNGLENIEVGKVGHLVGRGRRPARREAPFLSAAQAIAR